MPRVACRCGALRDPALAPACFVCGSTISITEPLSLSEVYATLKDWATILLTLDHSPAAEAVADAIQWADTSRDPERARSPRP